MKIEAVDLFCGAGGLTAGLLQAGVKVKAGYDIEPACRFAYEHNNKTSFVLKDVSEVTAEEIEEWYSKDCIRLLAGCAPCQPFSTYNQGKNAESHKQWPLLYHFSRLIREVKPDLVTMENVPDVINHQVYRDFVLELESLGYNIAAQEIYCAQYGLPQSRRRHVLLASRLKGKPEINPPSHDIPVTVEETIKHLPAIKAGETHSTDHLHVASKLSVLNMKRIKASSPGGTWRDWPHELVAECHKKVTGKSYPGVYGRMSWDKPSPTITTLCYGFGNGRFGHPEQDRAISLREAALLQTFPADYQFIDPQERVTIRAIGRMIGNAVPVRLGEVVGLSLIKYVAMQKTMV
jgi:DNA (cytosine-5)-methyltransferase 1